VSVVIVALIVAVGAIIQIHVNGQQRSRDKQEDWERQDIVANRLTARQDAIAAQAREAASLLVANNRVVAETAAQTQGQLTVIHDLVNSTMTEAKQSELVALRGQLVLMGRVMALNEEQGITPTDEDRAALDAIDARVAEVQAIVDDRVHQQQIIDDKS
jgi:hypothetical protein